MKFIDLFAGLGGFHQGFANTGGYECVFACEIDSHLRELYEFNYGLMAAGDIKTVDEKSVPDHEILCAGFPCQPFSLAGLKKGTACPKNGKFIDDVLRIAAHSKPEFLILENVPGIRTIGNGEFWNHLNRSFEQLGYNLAHKIISPEDVGIPHNRKRLFIVGSMNHDLTKIFDFKKPQHRTSLDEVFDNALRHKILETQKRQQLEKWQQLLVNCKLPMEMPSLTISAPEFGATYPEDFSKLTVKDMRTHAGAYGEELGPARTWNELLEKLPSYCRNGRRVPDWLKKSVDFSRDIYKKNRTFLDEWCIDFNKTNNSWQLLEWRGYKKIRNFDAYFVQFRASGIRVTKANKVPSLVAMTRTQVPIIGSEMRYLSKFEAARLQNFHALPKIPENDVAAFRALGNAVNVKIVELIASKIKYITIPYS